MIIKCLSVYYRLLLIIVVTLFLTNCGSQTLFTDSVKPTATLNTWQIRASLTIDNKLAHEKNRINVYWEQKNDRYSIVLLGPLGFNLGKIVGDSQQVTFTQKQNTIHEHSPDTILKNTTGLSLPISDLVYIMRGLPPVKNISDKKYNNKNQLIEISTPTYQAQLSNYKQVNGYILPTVILIDTQQVLVSINITQWSA